MEVVFYESAKIKGTDRYKLDGISGILAEVQNGKVRLVTEQKIYEKIEESDQHYQYETGKIILQNGNTEYKVVPVAKPDAGENGAVTESKVDNNNDVTIVIKSDGKYYLRTVATDENGVQTTTDTELTNNGKEIVVTDYAALVYAQAVTVNGSSYKPQFNLEGVKLDSGNNVVDPGNPLFYNTSTKDGYL